MKICFFGSYDSLSYNQLILKLLQHQTIRVIQCQKEVFGVGSFFKSYLTLFFKHLKLDYDIMVIPWKGIITLPLAKLIAKGPIVYFAYLSIYQTLVEDRRLIKKNSLKAKIIHLIELLACRWSDLLICDTNENINYFCKEYNLKPEKFRQSMISLDESIFNPLPIKKQEKNFAVLFIGTYIPLHGIEIIIEAANILKNEHNIQFTLIGDGQERPKIEKMIKKYNLSNVTLKNSVKLNSLPDILKSSDVCLGIFNGGKKAMSVIPHKVLIALGSQKPLITAKSPALKEALLMNKENCILVEPENPKELADSILFLKKNPELSKQIAINGYNNFKKNLSMEIISKQLEKDLQELIKK